MMATAALLALALLVSRTFASECGPTGGWIAIAGSTTVAPIGSLGPGLHGEMQRH
jgi:ABC-type phosphate transport system substrate-binding protein